MGELRPEGHMSSPREFLGSTSVAIILMISVVAFLAGLIFYFGFFPNYHRERSGPELEIQALSTALESYKVEYGDYPTNSLPGAKGSAEIYMALAISNSHSNPRGKIFFEPFKGIASGTNFTNPGTYFVDPHGAPYEYRYDPGPKGTNHSGPGFFDLWSYGGVKGSKTNDTPGNWIYWIKNW